MSCMEHTCRGCGATIFDNRPIAELCPTCGGTDFIDHFDELPEREDDHDDDRDDD